MRRLLPAVLVLALLAGTAAAFAVTEGLKTTTSPVSGTRLERKVFSPVCGCRSSTASVSVRLRRADRATVEVVSAAGRSVALLADARIAAGEHTFVWDGKTDGGVRARDGAYRFRIGLEDADRVLTLPNRVRLDTRPPAIAVAAAGPGGRFLVVRYRVDEPAHGLLFVGGRRVLYTRFQRLRDTMRIGLDVLTAAGRSGELEVAAEDTAGNVSRRVSLDARVSGGLVTGWKR